MRILLIGFTKLAYMPYMNFYLEQVLKEENEVHLLYWNRDEKNDITMSSEIILHEFKYYQEDQIPKINKIKGFLRYYSYTNKLLNKYKFDLIIVMHTVPAVLLYTKLVTKFNKRFIFDFRDLTYEGIYIYKKIVHSLVSNSIMTFVSSDAFRESLPPVDHIYTSHNILLDSLQHRDLRREKERNNNPIRIRFWGFIRHEKINKQFIDCISNDRRFELHYHGREQETARNLKEYCRENHIKNVFFHGVYYPEDRYDFVGKTDLLHNIYENDNKTDKAMGNKYYDGVLFYIPQLCNIGSYMGNLVKRSSVGLECNLNSTTFADDIYEYYRTIKWDKLVKNCDVELERILEEYKKGIDLIGEATQQKQ